MAVDLEAGVAAPAATPARGAEAELAETVRPIARRANGPAVPRKISHDRPLIQDLHMFAERTDGGEVGIHDDNVAGFPECQRVQGLVRYAAKRSHYMGGQGGIGQQTFRRALVHWIDRVEADVEAIRRLEGELHAIFAAAAQVGHREIAAKRLEDSAAQRRRARARVIEVFGMDAEFRDFSRRLDSDA